MAVIPKIALQLELPLPIQQNSVEPDHGCTSKIIKEDVTILLAKKGYFLVKHSAVCSLKKSLFIKTERARNY